MWQTDNRTLASKLEYHIKTLKKSQKEQLILKNNIDELLSNKVDAEQYKKIY